MSGAPLLTQTPDADEWIWQKVMQKYDAERKRLFEQVGRGNQEGPFQPEWGSLEHQKILGWYQDAKFGIFIIPVFFTLTGGWASLPSEAM
jgi:hypothetical protein